MQHQVENKSVQALEPTNKKPMILIIIAVVLCLAMTSYAMTVDSFTDYNPPDYLYINWYDYMKDDMPPDGTSGAATVNNAISNHPRWSVEYPYRAIFLGGTPSKVIDYYVVYSKVPTTDLFTFEYTSGEKSTYQIGRIRAYISSGKVGSGKDFRIFRVGHNSDGTPSLISSGAETRFDVSGSGVGTSGSKYYFSFDFFYDCASEHQQYAGDLNISGVTSISSVPYKYVTKCIDHVGGHNTGGSSGGSSSSGSSGQKWGNGQYGGGIDWGSGGSPSINSGGGYGSRNDIKLSPSDDWQSTYEGGAGKSYSWEKDSNIPNFDFSITIPPFTGKGEGDTGYSGGTIPDFSVKPPPLIDFNFTSPSMPGKDTFTIIGIPPELYFSSNWPPKVPK